ncbi:mannosyltransferase [Rhizobium leguminosarum bv. trifolii CB782]|nr:mannosyltransferase [Rhizobium leguminosarum bv. trifolii CB782]
MRLLLHAPNVNSGGGLQLLRAILAVVPSPISWAQLDKRADIGGLSLGKMPIRLVRNTVWSRLAAEWRLRKKCGADDIVLCFNGLPPIFALPCKVVVFVQNRLLVEDSPLSNYPLRTRVRITAERWLLATLRGRSSRYVVQTPSMAAVLQNRFGLAIPVVVSPFIPEDVAPGEDLAEGDEDSFDFVYVASGEAHKNHVNLLEAWRILAEYGHRPSLALTLGTGANPLLEKKIARLVRDEQIAVSNCGALTTTQVDELYHRARALIYPSAVESLGLPLIEASRHGLPILASEKDYVRDIVTPVQTFDPDSPLSIARAVMRFMGVSKAPTEVGTADDFLSDVVR